MDMLAIFESAVTVCFTLSGAFFAAAALVFFLFKIPRVMSSLSGRHRLAAVQPEPRAYTAQRRAAPTPDAAPAAPAQPRPVAPAQPSASGSNTVWLDERQTSSLESQSDETTEQLGKAEDGERTTASLERGGAGDYGTTVETAKQRLGFKPEVSIVVYHTEERI